MSERAAVAEQVLFEAAPPYKLETWAGLIRAGEPRVLRRAMVAVALGWLPLALLTAVHGDLFRPQRANVFIFDVGAYARFLIASPMLIFAEAICVPRLAGIARHFVDSGLVAESDRARYDEAVNSTRRLMNSTAVEIASAILVYALVVVTFLTQPAVGVPGWHGSAIGATFVLSPAGWWGALVSLPILLVLLLGWLWRVWLWTRFLWLMSRLELRLIPAHPDHAAGLMFVGVSLEAFTPVAFAVGFIAAGGVANRVVNFGASVLDFKPVVVGVVVFVVALFVGPLTVFIRRLSVQRHRGILAYSALALRLGEQFERKWLKRRQPVDKGTLEVPDFSTTTDLFSVVEHAYDVRILPVDLKNLLLLLAATLLPFVPVVLLIVPPSVILRKVAELLF